MLLLFQSDNKHISRKLIALLFLALQSIPLARPTGQDLLPRTVPVRWRLLQALQHLRPFRSCLRGLLARKPVQFGAGLLPQKSLLPDKQTKQREMRQPVEEHPLEKEEGGAPHKKDI